MHLIILIGDKIPFSSDELDIFELHLCNITGIEKRHGTDKGHTDK